MQLRRLMRVFVVVIVCCFVLYTELFSLYGDESDAAPLESDEDGETLTEVHNHAHEAYDTALTAKFLEAVSELRIDQVREYLKDPKVDPNAADAKGTALLRLAQHPGGASEPVVSLLKLLLDDERVDPNLVAENWTPLKVAISRSHTEAAAAIAACPRTILEVSPVGLPCTCLSSIPQSVAVIREIGIPECLMRHERVVDRRQSVLWNEKQPRVARRIDRRPKVEEEAAKKPANTKAHLLQTRSVAFDPEGYSSFFACLGDYLFPGVSNVAFVGMAAAVAGSWTFFIIIVFLSKPPANRGERPQPPNEPAAQPGVPEQDAAPEADDRVE